MDQVQTMDRQNAIKKDNIASLNEKYNDGDQADQATFAEMRSNLLLVAGDHYQKRQSNFYKRIRDTRDLNNEQKVRLTKNHIQKITKTYVNNIMSGEPGVGFSPKIDGDLQQQKLCDMHHALWRDAHERYDIDDLMDDWCDEFVQLGEAIVKIFYDPSSGRVKGYKPQVYPDDHELAGNPVLDEMGQPQDDLQSPIFTGGFVFEEIFAFNLLRPSDCKDIRKAEWLGLRKMVNKDELLGKFTDPEVQKFIQVSSEDTYVVFDGTSGGYKRGKNQVMVREYYFRPCWKYPRGYFFITTKEGILAEGELPGGVFPIVLQPLEKVPTTPRGRSPVRVMRPYQAEINRSASKIAEHQVTLGDDKILIQNGTKVSSGVALPGVRALNFTGMTPTILAGRDGSQYLNYMQAQIVEMYQVMNVAEDSQENAGQLDPYTLLFRSAKQKRKFQRNIKRFEKFLIQVVKVYLQLAKIHLSDEDLIEAMGKREQINIPEIRNSALKEFTIKIEAQSDDVETKLGKQIVLNHVMQYVGPQLKPDQVGQIMRAMPYAEVDGSFDDFTMDTDTVSNEILALDRGEQPPVHEKDPHDYAMKRLLKRMREPDYKFLDAAIQANYESKLAVHTQIAAFQAEAIQRAEQGFIPTGGYSVKCDFYVEDPSDPTGGRIRRAALPYQAVEWLVKQLEAQGQGMEAMQNMDKSLQASLANQVVNSPGFRPMGNSAPASGPMQGGMPGARPPGLMSMGRGAQPGFPNHGNPGVAAPGR